MKARSVVVIGAGSAGLSAAWQLTRPLDGEELPDVTVYEAGSKVGGLARSIDLWDQPVDLGPHRFFTRDQRVNGLWRELAGDDFEWVDRLTRIYYKDTFFRYPLQAFDALKRLGIGASFACLLSYGRQRIAPYGDESTFEGWVTRRFGRKLYERFFKSYSEKLWGIGCDELDADFAAQRIKGLSLGAALLNALGERSGSKHKTLVDRFAYPHEGSGIIYDRMRDSVRTAGGKVYTDAPIRGIKLDGNKVTGVVKADGSTHECDQVISSMPLTALLRALGDHVPSEVRATINDLSFRSTILVYLRVDALDLFPDQWLYVHDTRLLTGRITNFANWNMPNAPKHSTLCLEYWCNEGDEFWAKDDATIAKLAADELKKTGLIGAHDVADNHVLRIGKNYPVYFRGYREKLKPVIAYLKQIEGLQVIGRYGAYKYNNQDHSLLMGLMAADNLRGKAGGSLWDVNTDYEEYQEEGSWKEEE